MVLFFNRSKGNTVKNRGSRRYCEKDETRVQILPPLKEILGRRLGSRLTSSQEICHNSGV